MIELTTRQLQIIEIVKKRAPITGDQIAESLGLSRPTIRGDLSILVMLEYVDAKPKVGYFPGTKAAARHNSRGLLQDTKVSDIQSIPVIIRENTTIQDAVVTLFLQDVGTLIICDSNGKLTGVASRKDFLKVTLGNPGAVTMPVSMVMTRQPKVVTVSPDDTVLDAAQRMIYHEVDSLPVVIPGSGEGSATGLDVVGRLTKTSIVKLLLELEAKG
ncbi:helix-turn-helix transcriptional regulator [Paenibacillus tritici]|uniref:Helix-turn-helix transcriptional regulator n=1 Tax=Paenibacillus tritici TaxID=1873425 RepID=A0ABX2DRN5_9BACL|nr:helix-turn-helix transcriptional regulator [Paenibacillus tritici]NQX47349.1 helix-turn-helix transcriptional regulator [Paenibacillus tritici]QUL55980.1 helix-turn-helix transcriptional regulator [Paenibacillus tritici]